MSQIPAAPYPPSAPISRSALSTSPLYYPQQQQRRDAVDNRITSKLKSTSPTCRVLFCPLQPNVYACINCVSPNNITTTTVAAAADSDAVMLSKMEQATSNKRTGPVLLELRRLQLHEDAIHEDVEIQQQQQQQQQVSRHSNTSLLDSITLTVSQGNPSLGNSVVSTCMAYPDIRDVATIPEYAPCATGLSTGALCIHSFVTHDNNNENTLSASNMYFATRHQRRASAVAWRPGYCSQVAIGLVSTLSGGSASGHRPRGVRSAGGDKEFCCLLWDVTKGTTTAPISKLSHNVGVASLAWLSEGQTLCVGSQLRHFHIYDLRMSGTTSSPTSVWAHTDAVSGMEADPSRPDIMATFGGTAGEPVKLWDIRRMDTSVGEIKTAGGIVQAMKWSSLYPGTLSIALGDTVQHYDTTASLSRPVLTRLSHAESTVLDLALYPKTHVQNSRSETMDEEQSQDIVSDLYRNRMLVVLADRSVKDIPKVPEAPLAISRRDGSLAHAFAGALWVESSSEGPSAMENPLAQKDEDISARMMRRAKCSRTTRYSMDAALNLQMLSEELDSQGDGDETESSLPSIRMLVRLWSWIERIERFCSQKEVYGVEKWPGKGLADSGVWRLLHFDNTTNNDAGTSEDSITLDESLALNVYDSPTRRFALSACGWAGTESETLSDIQVEIEATGEFERSAALAVWHGDIGAGVEALQRGAVVIQSLDDMDGPDIPHFSPHYAETLQLVSMCIAGYRGSDSTLSWSPVWRKACLNLLKRDDLSGVNAKKVRVAYLRSICTFLVSIGIDDGLKSVLHDDQLSICDRVGFACRFLEQGELRRYLDGCVSYCQESGNLEGLIVTGIEMHGLKVMQAYVDKFADVQTAALICSRAVFAVEWERSICLQWLDAYRTLLNTWQMWQSRAMFDVDVADYVSKLKERQEAEMHGGRIMNYQSRRMMHPSIPAQLDARCNKCSKSLTGLRGRQEGAAPQRLAKANPKPVLSCCPHCLNALPRCSICLLSLGCLNPYMEVKKERANLPIAEWFTWCMQCKHGGHAHHLVGWFANHDICPVSGCDCKCQFDAMQKLHRRLNNVNLNDDEAETESSIEDNVVDEEST